jgi:hypothetical protein
MFRALLTHPQKVLNTRHLVYSVRVMSVDCTLVQITDIYYYVLYNIIASGKLNILPVPVAAWSKA